MKEKKIYDKRSFDELINQNTMKIHEALLMEGSKGMKMRCMPTGKMAKNRRKNSKCK